MPGGDLEAALTSIRQQLSVITIRITQQERIIAGLRDGAGRLDALSALTSMLRQQYELELKRDELQRSLQLNGKPDQQL